MVQSSRHRPRRNATPRDGLTPCLEMKLVHFLLVVCGSAAALRTAAAAAATDCPSADASYRQAFEPGGKCNIRSNTAAVRDVAVSGGGSGNSSAASCGADCTDITSQAIDACQKQPFETWNMVRACSLLCGQDPIPSVGSSPTRRLCAAVQPAPPGGKQAHDQRLLPALCH